MGSRARRVAPTLPDGSVQNPGTEHPRARARELEELIETLGTLVRGVDSRMLAAWERLKTPASVPSESVAGEPARDDIHPQHCGCSRR